MKRSIVTAINTITGEIVNSDLIFNTQKEGQEIRKIDKQTSGDDFCCYECGQFLETTSRNKNVFFKHKKWHSPCIFTDDGDNKISKQELEEFFLMNRIKEESQDSYAVKRSTEGERHYNLKKQIVSKLKKTDYITEVQDEKVIKKDSQFKKADIYFEYKGRKIVIEIQISKLSARYIFSRYDFYKSQGIYLIWIVDVILKEQDQFSIDIKYLNAYENYFNIVGEVTNFQLFCKYKNVYITAFNELRTHWETKSIDLSELQFSEDIFQVFYYDLTKERQKKEGIRLERIKKEKLEEERQQRIEEERKNELFIQWKSNWLMKFDKTQRNSDAFLENSVGDILYFTKDDLNYFDIKKIENQLPNLIWIVNVNKIKNSIEFTETFTSKLKEFNKKREDDLAKTKTDLENSFSENEISLKKELRKEEQNLKELKELENIWKLKPEKTKNLPNDYLLYFWDPTLKKVDNTTDLYKKIESLFKDQILSCKQERLDFLNQKDKSEKEIKTWKDKEGLIIRGKILRLKPSFEITFEELSKNGDRILFKDIDSQNIDILKEPDIEKVLASPKSYFVYDDYSKRIEEWMADIKKIESKIEESKTRLKAIQENIEVEALKWFNLRLSETQIKIETTEKAIKLINNKIDSITKEKETIVSSLIQEQDVQRKSMIENHKWDYRIEWNYYDLSWHHVAKPIFFEIDEGLYYKGDPNSLDVRFYTREMFLEEFNN
ncbi:MAG: hypothetical protein K0M50_09785 [Prolixibacteraceae bacterium]|nr:hypothetical protein [Prolixibacteraceae bacterium]